VDRIACVILPTSCNGGSFTALQKAPALRARIELAAGESSAHRRFTGPRVPWSYPAKPVSKSDAPIITYQHSSDKHLENSLARRARDEFVKKFWRWPKIVTRCATFSILRTDSKTCFGACEQLSRGVNRGQVF
jgi:hypothetical protein